MHAKGCDCNILTAVLEELEISNAIILTSTGMFSNAQELIEVCDCVLIRKDSRNWSLLTRCFLQNQYPGHPIVQIDEHSTSDRRQQSFKVSFMQSYQTRINKKHAGEI